MIKQRFQSKYSHNTGGGLLTINQNPLNDEEEEEEEEKKKKFDFIIICAVPNEIIGIKKQLIKMNIKKGEMISNVIPHELYEYVNNDDEKKLYRIGLFCQEEMGGEYTQKLLNVIYENRKCFVDEEKTSFFLIGMCAGFKNKRKKIGMLGDVCLYQKAVRLETHGVIKDNTWLNRDVDVSHVPSYTRSALNFFQCSSINGFNIYRTDVLTAMNINLDVEKLRVEQKDYFRKVGSLEMESYYFYKYIKQNFSDFNNLQLKKKKFALVIKGISDNGTSETKNVSENMKRFTQTTATRNALLVLFKFLNENLNCGFIVEDDKKTSEEFYSKLRFDREQSASDRTVRKKPKNYKISEYFNVIKALVFVCLFSIIIYYLYSRELCKM